MEQNDKIIPQKILDIQREYEGFIIEDIRVLPEVLSVAYIARHLKTGARLIHLHNNDPENLLALCFRTPPPDDTGLPHILEHTVLCGSKRYPVKDPFVEMLKTSLATFLNAMTYPDKTVYPCASMVEKDFFNLSSVYCDAVFNPLLKEEHFKQEGFHFDFETPGDITSPLIVKGIVYNEMKGVYSSLDGLISRETVRSICPDNAYGKDSGGVPDEIITLTYKRFIDYHHTYYHPSNLFVFLYGNIETIKLLSFLNKQFLSNFNKIDVASSISLQPRWKEPKRKTIPYPIASHEEVREKSAVCLTFLTNDVIDTIKTLAMRVLDFYLLDNAASPLRKALIDSHLGQELTSSGYADYQRDTFFTVGLKGSEPDRADAIEELIFKVLKDEVKKGLDREKLEAAFHRLELSARQITGHYPLRLMDLVFSSWIYEADPLYNLNICSHLNELRKTYKNNPRFFEDVLTELLIENPHFTRLTFIPDPDLSNRQKREFKKKMEEIKSSFSKEELIEIDKEARRLELLQLKPNPPEALKTLPKLSKKEISSEPYELGTQEDDLEGLCVLFTRMQTNELCYLLCAFDISGIELIDDGSLIPYLPLFSEAVVKMGTDKKDYATIAHEEALVSGGISAGVNLGFKIEDDRFFRPIFSMGSNAIKRNLDKMLDIYFERLKRADFSDTARLKDIILQGMVARKSSLIPHGNSYAESYASRTISSKTWLLEEISGISQIRFFDYLSKNFDKASDEIVDKLSKIKRFLLEDSKVFISIVGDEDSYKMCRNRLSKEFSSFIGRGENSKGISESIKRFNDIKTLKDKTIDALVTQTDVSFVAMSMPSLGFKDRLSPTLLLLSRHLSLSYLWEQIRVKNGAYGAKASFSPSLNIFSISSYRDPKIRETLECYLRLIDFVEKDMDLSEDSIEQAIIGTFKLFDRPIRPAQALSLSLNRFMSGEDVNFRRSLRRALLDTTAQDIQELTNKVLKTNIKDARFAVICNSKDLEEVEPQLLDMGFSINKKEI